MNTDKLEQKLRKKLLHQSNYRGWKENDILVGKFATDQINNLSLDELQSFKDLLDENDNDLFRILTGKAEIPKHIHPVLKSKLEEYFEI